jgi:23S rRNA pseudouridine1911/1915/1917 synthase
MNRGYRYREQIDARGHGRQLLQYLSDIYPRDAPADWHARIEAGLISVAGQAARPDAVLRRGDVLEWNRPPWAEPAVPLTFDVLFEDHHLLAVSKPSGLPTMPGGGFLEHTLLHLVRQRSPGASPMHRLGRGTSGVVLFARTPETRSAMQDAWRKRRVRKIYRALVSGRIASNELAIDIPIGRVPHPRLGDVFAPSGSGKPSRSHVRLIEQRPSEALVDVEIETGRPHQIRIHLAAAGHPLRGDPLYTPGGIPIATSKPGDLGYLLHARHLSFIHPQTGEPIAIEAPLPAALRASGER